MAVTSILDDCDVARRGLDIGDEILTFAGRPITSVNQFKNVLGLYPRGWRLPLEYRRDSSAPEILVRLMGVQRKVIKASRASLVLSRDRAEARAGSWADRSRRKVRLPSSMSPGPGFANYYFNSLERDRLLAAFKKHGDFAP